MTAFYQDSHDFNGMPFADLAHRLRAPKPSALHAVRALVRRGELSAIFGDIHPNAHIRALPDEPIPSQLTKLRPDSNACLYPTETTLAKVIPSNLHADRPFTRRLALGEPQLSYAAFDLAILESYRNDPRYVFEAGDAGGMISVTDEYYESAGMPERDQVLLQTFGFCYGPTKRRAVGVFLRYLSDLSPEHQKIWHARMLTGDYKMHPDYWASSMGHWPEGASVFEATLAEMAFINRMAAAMGRGQLFKRDFGDARPTEFAFLLRPTQKDFDTFVQTLDKMLSENIDPAFFRGDVERETHETRKNGEVVVKPKGTITMLQEWVGRHFRSKDPAVPALFETLKEVRKLRSHPSHALCANVYDETIFDRQRELVIRIYHALTTLRLILAYWPETKGCEVPRILRGETTIWTM
ncbi:MAG TPA: AAA family ATPase [Thermoanaerobaculia bacterium]|nr:AAA family ATPase [Thermoanaerobaculia bacterium]